MERNMKNILMTLTVLLSAMAAKANDKPDLTFWYTGGRMGDLHHSEDCSPLNYTAILSQSDTAWMKSRTPLNYYSIGFGDLGCGTFRLSDFEKRAKQFIELGKEIPCPANVCAPGTHSAVEDLAKNESILDIDTDKYETVRTVYSVMFFDQGYMAVEYRDLDDENEGPSVHVAKIDSSRSLRQQVQRATAELENACMKDMSRENRTRNGCRQAEDSQYSGQGQ
jgi:hypothetical protein